MFNEEELGLFHDAKQGIEIESFLKSPVGVFFVDRADRERLSAIDEFKNCDITNQAEVQRIQNAIKIPDLIIRWLLDAIEEGRACEFQLKKQQALSDSYEDMPGKIM